MIQPRNNKEFHPIGELIPESLDELKGSGPSRREEREREGNEKPRDRSSDTTASDQAPATKGEENQHDTKPKGKKSERDSKSRSGEPHQQKRTPEKKRGRYELNLAEFPLFRLSKRSSHRSPGTPDSNTLVYRDTITGRDNQIVQRKWEVKGASGLGGPSTQETLWDLLQIWKEQGFQDTRIAFGTLSTLLRRRGYRKPSRSDLNRVKRDLDILVGLTIYCKNAFWDNKVKAYIDRAWHPFRYYDCFHEKPDGQEVLPLGYIVVDEIFLDIVHKGGAFLLSFDSEFYHSLTPLEQRLALYLSKMLRIHFIHRRDMLQLAEQLPIRAKRPRDVKKTLKRAAQGLVDKHFPILDHFEFYKNQDKREIVAFYRKSKGDTRVRTTSDGEAEVLVEDIIKLTGDKKNRNWWKICAERLGSSSVYRGLGQLRETCQLREVQNRGAMLTKIFKDIAKQAGIELTNKP